MDETVSNTYQSQEASTTLKMNDVGTKKRKIESDGGKSDDSKKPRTGETGCDEAGPVMVECTDALIHSEHDGGTAAVEASLHETANTEDENHMSVDIAVEDSTTAAAISSYTVSRAAALPAGSTKSSSVTDVIDVDAVDMESSCDKAQKDKSIEHVNPLELGLNEYYLQPASDDKQADDVIDVDADATQAAGLSETVAVTAAAAHTSLANVTGSKEVSLKYVEEKSHGKVTSEVDTETETASHELTDDKPEEGPATDVKVDSIETAASSSPSAVQKKTSSVDAASGNTNSVSTDFANDQSDDGAAIDSCTEVQETELVITSSTEHHEIQRLEAADVVKVAANVAEMVTLTQVTERAVTSQECSADKAVVVEAAEHVTVQAGNDTNLTSPRAAVEPEAEMLTVMRTAPAEDASSVCGSEEATTKQVQHIGGDSRDEKMTVDDSQTEVAEVFSEDTASLWRTENLTGATEGGNVTDRGSSDGESTAQLLTSRDAAGLSEVQHELLEENCATDEVIVDIRQTDIAVAAGEEHTSLQMKENATDVTSGGDVTDKVSPDNYTAQVMEMTDKPVSGSTDEANQFMKTVDIVVLDSEDMKESTEVRNSATVNMGNDPQHPEPLLTENILDATEGRDVTDRSTSGGESAAQLIADSDEAGMDIEVVVSSAGEIQQTAQDVKQHTEMMLKGDVSLCEDMTDVAVTEVTVKAVCSEEYTLEHKDVSDNIETSQQSVDMIAETNNGEGVPECKEMKDVAVTDNAESAENAVTTDENTSQLKEMEDMAVTDKRDEQQNEVHTVINDVALSDVMVDTDVLLKESGAMTTSATQPVDTTADKVETTAEDTAMTHSRVSDELEKHTADCGKTDGMDMSGMVLKMDERSITGEIARSEASAKVHGGKSEQEGLEMAVNPLTSDDAAE